MGKLDKEHAFIGYNPAHGLRFILVGQCSRLIDIRREQIMLGRYFATLAFKCGDVLKTGEFEVKIDHFKSAKSEKPTECIACIINIAEMLMNAAEDSKKRTDGYNTGAVPTEEKK